jgi:hypothetical protein
VRRLALLLLPLLGACSVEDGAGAPEEPVATTPSTTVTVAAPGSTTTTAAPVSAAVVRIGPARYDLEARCAAPGAGEVQVALTGTDVNGLPVVGYVQAFLGEPYVGMQVGEGREAVLYESRLDEVLDFELANDILTFAEVDFVSGLDLESGAFTPAGIGSVAVECRGYERELPPTAIG